MKIAIIGSGFAGLAVAWYLAFHQKKVREITLFDKRGFLQSTSRTAAGLFHPFSGKRLTVSPLGKEAYQEACLLLQETRAFQEEDALLHRGMLRLFLPSEKPFFKKIFEKHPHWLDEREVKKYHPDLAPHHGIFIEEAQAIDPNLYLNALMRGLTHYGAEFIEKSVESLDELKSFDATVVAAGYETLAFKETKDLPFHILKGQGLEFCLPSDMAPLEQAISSDIYVVMMKDRKRLFAGATFERGISDPYPDEKIAKEKILPKLFTLFPKLASEEPLAIRSNIRLTTKGYFPYAKKIGPKLWVFSGLGSKGLLYHAFLGKKLAEEIAR